MQLCYTLVSCLDRILDNTTRQCNDRYIIYMKIALSSSKNIDSCTKTILDIQVMIIDPHLEMLEMSLSFFFSSLQRGYV